jgi:cyclopropane fatty-acyl-phospholipid synthase-like methyltransferase
LYAKVEPFIGFDEAYEELYQTYLEKLSDYKIKTILDVGCGNGNFLLHLQKLYLAQGIDISYEMVKIAQAKGVDASCLPLEKVEQKYDALLSVADVLNYLDKSDLEKFLKDVESHLFDDGIFICDINTLFGFSEVTAGSLSIDEDDTFISIDSEFEDEKLYTTITMFTKDGKNYTKEQEDILQYYHTIKDIENLSSLKLVSVDEVALFSKESDKSLLVFRKETRECSKNFDTP